MRRRLTANTLAALLFSTSILAACESVSPVAPQDGPVTSRVRHTSGDIGVLSRLVLLEASSPIGEDSAATVIGPEGGTLRIPGGHRIDFPAGALLEATRVSARVGGTQVLKVTFAPHGLQFPEDRQPALTMSYGILDDLLFIRPTIVYVDDADRIVEHWPGIWNILSRTTKARIGHFSSYALASN